MITVTVDAEQAGTRLDRLVHEISTSISRAEAQRLVDAGAVRVDGDARGRAFRVQRGMRVEVDEVEDVDDVDGPVAPAAAPVVLEPTIVYQDDWLVVVDKPVGLVTHAAPSVQGVSLATLLAERGLAGGGDADRPGIVHRLDRETSGLLIVARDDETRLALQRQLRDREVEREYVVLVHGRPPSRAGRIEAPIGRDPANRTRRAIDGIGARQATTHFELVEAFAEHTLLVMRLETGRTHQIRVHLAAIKHPVVGDPVYGHSSSDTLGLTHQALHAHHVAFAHPLTGIRLDFRTEVPADFEQALAHLRLIDSGV